MGEVAKIEGGEHFHLEEGQKMTIEKVEQIIWRRSGKLKKKTKHHRSQKPTEKSTQR